MQGANVKKIWQLFPLPHCGGVTDLLSVDTTKSRKWKWLLTNAGARVLLAMEFFKPISRWDYGIDA